MTEEETLREKFNEAAAGYPESREAPGEEQPAPHPDEEPAPTVEVPAEEPEATPEA